MQSRIHEEQTVPWKWSFVGVVLLEIPQMVKLQESHSQAEWHTAMLVSTARIARPVAHGIQAAQLRSPLLAILFLQSPMQPEKVAGRQLQTTCLEIRMRTNVQR